MQYKINFAGKSVVVTVSKNAAMRLDKLDKPLVMEMELYFSCLIRKAVYFGVEPNPELSCPVGEHLLLSFRPVMTNSCKVDSSKPPELTSFPIAKVSAYVPKWVNLDYRRGDWLGEFGYA